MHNPISGDRNFDDLVEHFQRRIYQSLKGEIRLNVINRDLFSVVPNVNRGEGKTVLDIGGGLGQFSIQFAKLGYRVYYNDLSFNMMQKAQERAKQENVFECIHWYCGPYQSFLKSEISENVDLIICHAVMEWLEQPEYLISSLVEHLRPNGYLSLCFYNPVSFIYRNLLRGNFRRLDESDYELKGGLTPINPQDRSSVLAWLHDAKMHIQSETGVRVFTDYVRDKQGGNSLPEEVIKQELKYSQLEPYKWMARYLHVIAHP